MQEQPPLSPSPIILRNWDQKVISSRVKSKVDELIAAADRKAMAFLNTSSASPSPAPTPRRTPSPSPSVGRPSPSSSRPASAPPTPPPHRSRPQSPSTASHAPQSSRKPRGRAVAGMPSLDIMTFKEHEVEAQLQALDSALQRTREKWTAHRRNVKTVSLQSLISSTSALPRRTAPVATPPVGSQTQPLMRQPSPEPTRPRPPVLSTEKRALIHQMRREEKERAEHERRGEGVRKVRVDVQKLLVEREEIERVMRGVAPGDTAEERGTVPPFVAGMARRRVN